MTGAVARLEDYPRRDAPRDGEVLPQPRTAREIRRIFKRYGEAAAATLAMIAADPLTPAVVRVMACREILSRGYGTPGPQSAHALDEDAPSDGTPTRLADLDLATMDDATLAQFLMEETQRQGRGAGR